METLFGGLMFGRKVRWRAQARSDRRVTLGEACRGLWPQVEGATP